MTRFALAALALLSFGTIAAADETPAPTPSNTYPLEEWVPTDTPTPEPSVAPSVTASAEPVPVVTRPGLPKTGQP